MNIVNSQAFSQGMRAWTSPNFDTFMGFGRPAFEAMAEINSRALEQIAAVNAEWVRFVQKRVAQDFDLPQQLAKCRMPQDVLRVYAEFAQNAVQQYQQELAEITRMNQAFNNETAEILRNTAEKASRHLNG